jgi:hypothetical protein
MDDEPESSQASPPDSSPELPEEMLRELLATIPNGTILAYNMDDTKTLGGLKVRLKIRVVSGPEAARWDARQAEAIKELLLWSSRHPPRA